MGLTGNDVQKHRYQLCGDEDCELPYCRIYREGYGNGREDERPVAYEAGFWDGINACPREHKG